MSIYKIKYKATQLLLLTRIHSPTGFFLLFLPCAMTIALYSKTLEQFCTLFVVIGLCSLIIRSAGCIINDLIDRSIDIHVARTKTRPLAAKTVTVTEALLFLALLLTIQLAILLYLPSKAIVASFTIFPLIIIYPILKRFTYFPQAFLGITFNFGVIVTYYAINQEFDWPIILLYLGCIFWTLGYDSIYGLMDHKDDIKINVKSFALLMIKHNYKFWLSIFYTIFICNVVTTLILVQKTISYPSIFTLGLAYLILIWQVVTLNKEDAVNCLKRFKMNNFVGLLIFIAYLLNNTQTFY